MSRNEVRSKRVRTTAYGMDSPATEDVPIDRFLGQAEFPATGKEIVETARRNGAPTYLLRALRRLTPRKAFHNTYEVWFDAVHPFPRVP
jgi:Protein of unknown function (DUF2795)